MEGEEREHMRGHEYLTYIWLTLVSIYEPSLSIKNEKTLTKKKEPSICLESLGTGRTNCTCYVSLSFSTLLSPPHNCYNIFSSPPYCSNHNLHRGTLDRELQVHWTKTKKFTLTQYSVVTFPKIGGPHEKNVIHGNVPKKHRVITLGDKIVKIR